MQTGKAISVPAILKVGNGTLNQLGSYLKGEGLKQVVIFLGNGLIDMFGETVMESLKKEEITVLEYSELDTVDIDDIITLAFSMPNKTQAVISIGGGKVIDAGKYAAFLRNIPFISVPTSSSSDGFSSASASLLVHGKRTSVPAKLAYGIVVDTQIIRTAPEKFIYSGIGDMISKITALYDWIYEEKCGYSTVNDFAVMIAKKAVNSFVRTPYQSIKDELFLKELVDSLAMSGIANEIAGSSAPTSGSEHLISHALDKLLEAPQLHGIQVGIATYIMSKVHNHRYVRVQTVLEETGFFDFAATLQMKKSDFLAAIDLKGLGDVYPFVNKQVFEGNNTISIQKATELVGEIAEKEGIEMKEGRVEEIWDKFDLKDFDMNRNILRSEMAILIDQILDPFNNKKVDIIGQYIQ